MHEDGDNSRPVTVQAKIALQVGGACLNATAHLPAGPSNLTQLLPVIQQLENAVVSRVGEEANRAGRPITCRAGCGACCRQMVAVSLFEAEALLEWVRSLPEERRKVLEERFHRALLALRDAGVIETLLDEGWMINDERTTKMAIDYFHAGVPCPFLEDESCSIHPFRPLICREYLVTSPAEYCQDPSVHQIAGIPFPLKLSKVLYAFGQQVAQDRRGWIPLIFLLGWGKSNPKPGDFITGSGEEVLRKFLEQAAEIDKNEDQNSD
ncbi:MAG: YkgJ family cysteine cluster protein [Terracidiphilus sp.]